MAKAKEVTTKFRVDLTDFKKGISQANQDIKVANAQFKAATASMDDWSKSSEGLEAKIKQLNDTLTAEKKKLAELEKQQLATKEAEQESAKAKDDLKKKIDSLQKEYEELVKTQGESSAEALEMKKALDGLNKEYSNAVKAQERNSKSAGDLEIKILNQKATIEKTKKELGNYEKSLTEVNSTNNKVKSSFEKLEDTIDEQETELKSLKKQYQNIVLEQGKNSKEAKALAKDMSSLNKKLEDSKSTMDKVESASDGLTSALKGIDGAASNSGDGFTILKGTIADLTSNVIQGAVSKIGELVSSLFDLDEATREYRSMSAKLEGSAKTFGYSADFASSKYKEFYKYLGDDQMATNAITNLMGLGTSTESISKLAEGATGVWASYGDSIPIESLTEAINETIQVGKVTGTFADTINWAKISNKEMAKSLGDGSKAQKAFNEAIKDGETQEDAFSAALAATSDEQERADLVAKFLNSTYGESKKTYDEMTGSIQDANAKELELKETQAKMAEAIAPVNSAFSDLKNQALEAVLPLVEKLAQAFLDFKAYLEEHPAVMGLVIGAVTALAGAFVVLAGALAIQGLINGVSMAMSFLSIAMSGVTLPIALIVGAIAGLVAGFLYLWNNVDGFKEFFVNAWEVIKNACAVAKEYISEKIDQIGKFFTETVPEFINKAVNYFKELPSRIWNWLLKVIQKVLEWRSNMLNKAKEIGSKFVTTIIDYAKSIPSKIWNAIVGAVSRVTEWGSNLIATGKEKISNFVSNIFNKAKEIPSKISNAISGAISKVVEWGSNMLSKGKEAAQKLVTGIVEKVKEIPDKIKDVGTNLVEGIWNGISNGYEWIKEKISGWVGNVTKFIKELFGINSPSTVMRDEVGKYLAQGIGVGFEDETDHVKRDMAKALNGITTQLSMPSLNLNGASYGGYASNSGMQGNNQTINFYQTNNSPKSLSRLEIYRQTNNALKRVKGGLNHV